MSKNVNDVRRATLVRKILEENENPVKNSLKTNNVICLCLNWQRTLAQSSRWWGYLSRDSQSLRCVAFSEKVPTNAMTRPDFAAGSDTVFRTASHKRRLALSSLLFVSDSHPIPFFSFIFFILI